MYASLLRVGSLKRCIRQHCLSQSAPLSVGAASKAVVLPYYQNGLLKFDFADSERLVKLKVINSWRDNCELIDSASAMSDISYSTEADTKVTTISIKSDTLENTESTTESQDKPLELTVAVPEYCNMQVRGKKMQFIQEKKLQGDLDVDIQIGDIAVNKARGDSVRLHAWDGNISIKTSIEGNIELSGKTVHAKMMNVDSLTLHALKLTVEALYSKSADIYTYGDAEINHMQGACNVTSDFGDLSLSGVEGRFSAQAMEGDIALQINRLLPSGHVQQLDQVGTVWESSAVASKGSIFARVDPSVKAALSLQSTHSLEGFAMAAENGDDAMPMVTIQADSLADEQRSVSKTDSVLKGVLTGSAVLKSSKNRKSGFNSGKINVLSHQTSSAAGATASQDSKPECSLALTAAGFVRLEALSWMEAIKQRHGLGTSSSSAI